MKSLKELAESLGPSKADKNKALVIEIVELVMKEGNFKTEINLGITKYDVLHKFREELTKVPDETIEKILSKVRLRLSQ